jgi:signal transduction histidine kinase
MVSVGWWLALRSLNRWRVTLARHNRRLAMQAKDLRQSNWALDQMVAERTRSLETQNRALQEHQEELEVAKEKAESANRAKDNFLSSISHELKTPLTSILSYSRLLHEFCDDESAEVRREFLDVITTETERLTRLINDVLDFSMIEMGRIALKKRRFKFEEIAIQSLNGIAGLCLQKDVRFQLDCRTEAWSYGDPDRIQQVIANLLSNAWKFSPRDGVIRVALTEIDGFVEIRVIDQGPGVPDQQKSYVFEKFTQGGDMLTAKPQGTGLGLSIAHTLVEAHDGTLHCEDNPSGGAVFVIRLPVQPEADEVRITGRT